MPIFMAAQIDLNSGEIEHPEASERFKKALEYLDRSLENLQFEQKGTLENQVYEGALASKTQLEEFVKSVW